MKHRQVKKIDTRDNVRTLTHNNFITAKGLTNLSLKARKLLYIAISQCKLNDDEFYEYEISIKDFANLMGVADSNVYHEADNITNQLMSCIILCKGKDEKSFRKYSIFSMCEYEKNGMLYFKLNSDMTSFLLHINKNFSKPLLSDFLKMNSPYSMALWHLMQREMKSKKPKSTDIITFDLSLQEIREVTGIENKFTKVSDVKRYVIDKAIREIYDNCAVKITYDNIKKGRNIIGFRFNAVNILHTDKDNIAQKTKDKITIFTLRQESMKRALTHEEKMMLEGLNNGTYEMDIKYIPPKKH